MNKIKSVKAKEIKDSRGNPTVEVELTTDKGSFTASCPSGASTGKNEAVALPAKQAIINVNKIIAPALIGKNPVNQKELDSLMAGLDGMENKSKLGANAILPVSVAICRAGAASEKLPLYKWISEIGNWKLEIRNWRMPYAMFNILNGGAHAVGKNELAIQEFMIAPQKKSFSENLVLCNKIFNNLSEIIKKNFKEVKTGDLSPINFTDKNEYSKKDRREPLRPTSSDYEKSPLKLVGDEGGFTPPISKTEQALFLLKNAIDDSSDVGVALDCAASQFYKDGKYRIDGKEFSRSELLEFYADIVKRFNIFSIEDPFGEDDWTGFSEIIKTLSKVLVVGDDLTTTNIGRIREAHSRDACNGVIIKPNQIGTVSEAISAAMLAKSYDWKIIASHRSGETMDTFIADLAVGVGADFIKSGSPSQPERMVKYNRLLEIESELNKNK